MITERNEELAALRAFGLLETAEQGAFDAEVAGNTQLAELAAALDDTAAQLALTAPPLSPRPPFNTATTSATSPPSRPSTPSGAK